MAINYPTSLDSFPNPTSTDLLDNASPTLDHWTQHGNVNDAIAALEAKVGANSSAVTTSHDYKLSGVTGTDKAVSKTGTETLTNKTLTSPIINVGSDATGDIYYRNSGGSFTRLAVGASGELLSSSGTVPQWIANPSTADASTTVKGVSEEATSAELGAGTAVGGTGARLFVNPSTLMPSGKIAPSFIQNFAGDGSDGALSVSSGTTNIDLGAAAVVVKQYTSISITGTGAVTFSNPHANGTIIIIKSQGDVTLTSSTIPNLDASGMGGAGGAGGALSTSSTPQTNNGGTNASIVNNYQDNTSSSVGVGGTASSVNGGAAASAFTNQFLYTLSTTTLTRRNIVIAPGNGGGGGSGGQSQLGGGGGTGGTGGRGGGALVIQCGGALNFTSALGVDVSGKNGSNGTSSTTTNGYQTGGGGGGGGGSSGMCLILYNTLTAASGTVNAKGGNGGTGGNVTVTGTGGGSASGAGGGGSGGATLTSASAAGGTAPTVGGGNANGNTGNSAAASSGAGGGGGTGAIAASGTAYSGTGGTGGTGGSTSTSLWLITKNYYIS